MIAISGFLTSLQFVFGRGSARDPAGGAYSAPPEPLAGLTGGEGRDKGRRKGGRGRNSTPLTHVHDDVER